MLLKGTRFVAIMLAALTLGLGFCHLMQLPSRLGWDQYLWVGSTVQGGLYAAFGSVGALISIAAIVVLFILAYFVREHGRPGFAFALAAAVLFAAAFVLWRVRSIRRIRAGDMGQRSGSRRLDQISRAMGVGPRDHRGR